MIFIIIADKFICSERLGQTTGVSGVAEPNLSFCLNRINLTEPQKVVLTCDTSCMFWGRGCPCVSWKSWTWTSWHSHCTRVTFLNHERHDTAQVALSLCCNLQVASCGWVGLPADGAAAADMRAHIDRASPSPWQQPVLLPYHTLCDCQLSLARCLKSCLLPLLIAHLLYTYWDISPFKEEHFLPTNLC